MISVDKIDENKFWFIAYFLLCSVLAVVLMNYYQLMLKEQAAFQMKEQQKPEYILNEKRLDFWDFVREHALALKKAKDENDPVYKELSVGLSMINPRLKLILGADRAGRREFLFYTDLCDNTLPIEEQSCSSAISLLENAPDLPEFSLGLCQHAPNEKLDAVDYKKNHIVDPAKIKYSVHSKDGLTDLTIFDDTLEGQKDWAGWFIKAHENFTPSEIFIDSALGERIYSNISAVHLKNTRDPSFNTANSCLPLEDFRHTVAKEINIDQPYKKVSTEPHVFYGVNKRNFRDETIGWYKHLEGRHIHLIRNGIE